MIANQIGRPHDEDNEEGRDASGNTAGHDELPFICRGFPRLTLEPVAPFSLKVTLKEAPVHRCDGGHKKAHFRLRTGGA